MGANKIKVDIEVVRKMSSNRDEHSCYYRSRIVFRRVSCERGVLMFVFNLLLYCANL